MNIKSQAIVKSRLSQTGLPALSKEVAIVTYSEIVVGSDQALVSFCVTFTRSLSVLS